MCAFHEVGKDVWACKDEKKGDFLVNNTIVEIGGRKKKIKQTDVVVRDDIDLPVDRALPLWVLGFAW